MMTLDKIIKELKLNVLAGKVNPNAIVSGAYVSDLLSDVMGNAGKGNIWITMQTHGNIVAVASLKELAAIIVVNDGKPEENTIQKAEAEGIVILSTKQRSFNTCGKLYKILEQDAVV
ncbi:MAG TPA: serine kinase [Bacteroidales bacterium]|jgi:hypothetical protein|nr:serine kinase [Bacteroidales bacterium]